MKRSVKTLGITAALAVMIPLSAYAATATGGSAGSASLTGKTATEAADKEEHFGKGGYRLFEQDLLQLLKLDEAAMKSKLAEGKTLAEIAAAQGVSRDALKTALTDSFNKKLEEQKKTFTDRLDGMIDKKGAARPDEHSRFHKPMFGDLSASAKALGLTNEELKTAIASDKSIADVAKERNIDVQLVIDAQKAAITDAVKQAVKDGKLTQAEADERLTAAGAIAEKMVNGKAFERGHKFRGTDHHK